MGANTWQKITGWSHKHEITQKIPTGGWRGAGVLPPSAISSFIPQASSLCPLTKSHRAQLKSIVLLTVCIQTRLEKDTGSGGYSVPGPRLCCALRRRQIPRTETPPTPTPTLSFKMEKRTPPPVAAPRPSPPLPPRPSAPPPAPLHYTVTLYRTQTFLLQGTLVRDYTPGKQRFPPKQGRGDARTKTRGQRGSAPSGSHLTVAQSRAGFVRTRARALPRAVAREATVSFLRLWRFPAGSGSGGSTGAALLGAQTSGKPNTRITKLARDQVHALSRQEARGPAAL